MSIMYGLDKLISITGQWVICVVNQMPWHMDEIPIAILSFKQKVPSGL